MPCGVNRLENEKKQMPLLVYKALNFTSNFVSWERMTNLSIYGVF